MSSTFQKATPPRVPSGLSCSGRSASVHSPTWNTQAMGESNAGSQSSSRAYQSLAFCSSVTWKDTILGAWSMFPFSRCGSFLVFVA